MKDELKQLKQKDLKPLRERLYIESDGICPIINKQFDLLDFVIDHQHKTLKETIGVNGAGLIRGCIHRQSNSFEGKVTNSYKRYGLDKFDISLPDVLRNLADYLERENTEYIHPNEKPKEPKLKKSSYNKLKKIYIDKGKFPVYPKSKKLTKPLENIYMRYNITPEYYK